MNFVYRFLIIVGMVYGSLGQASANRRVETINSVWRFQKANAGGQLFDPNYDDKAWTVVSIPHCWNNMDANDEELGYYRGAGWYRKNIRIDRAMAGKQVDIFFEGANQVTDIWVNGQHVGQHKGGYTRFNFDITPFLKFGEANHFCIRVNNEHNVDIPPLSADFTFFGGIYRDVYLRYKEPVHIATDNFASSGVYITTPQVNEEKALVNIRSLLANHTEKSQTVILSHRLIDEDGQEVGTFSAKVKLPRGKNSERATDKITIDSPNLWSPDSPYLYRVVTQVYDAKTKQLLDEVINPLGFRWFEFTADKGFFLNGKSLKLIGTNRHQDYKDLGNALTDEMHLSDIRLLKKMGGNFLRISHYPQDPVVLETCDRLGILSSVEIPIVNAITESEAFSENCLYMAREMVHQDFNHPSVIVWSYMNEVMLRPPFKGDEERMKIYHASVAELGGAIENVLRTEDGTRYTTISFHGNPKAYEEAGLIEIPMIQGWNLYQGWYSGKFDGFGQFLDNIKKKYPHKPQFITEYGADVDPRLHTFEPERFDFTSEYANKYHEYYLDAIKKRDFVAGATIWNLNDFYSESRADAVPHVNNKGITGVDRELKDTYLYYKMNFNPQPSVMIGSRNWLIRGGVADSASNSCLQPVTIYSNLPKIEVFHNGISVGHYPVVNHKITLQVPFVHGRNTLEASALHEGNKIVDVLDIDFRLVPFNLKSKETRFEEINVMLGTKRYFENRMHSQIWIPEQAYRPGSWGYIGGKPYHKTTKYGSQPTSEIDIIGTENDPIFQTQRIDIEAFKMDVPDGQYAVYLYWAELEADKERET
ncbi:MAG: glycoside hydrolase family 2 TIM barrel-domain containing protein, partial [Bacteroidales bacterium]